MSVYVCTRHRENEEEPESDTEGVDKAEGCLCGVVYKLRPRGI